MRNGCVTAKCSSVNDQFEDKGCFLFEGVVIAQ